ncbi:MAG: S1C family serine protease [Lachnospiraceae bacterium]
MEIKRKNKPLNKRKLFSRVVTGVCVGLAFGLAASASVLLCAPKLKEVLGLTKENNVVIKVGGSREGESQKTILDNATAAREYDTLAEHQQMNYSLYGVGSQVGKILVGINLANSGAGKQYYSDVGCGIILTQTSDEVLILATPGVVKEEEVAPITFYGGQTVSGQVYARDKETGITIIRVGLEMLNQYTRNTIDIAKIGDSTSTNRGEYVIAVGCPLGELRSILVGELTSVRRKVQYYDREYSILETDILGKSYSEGFLIDQSGGIIGVLTHDGDEAGESTVLKAVAISELSEVMEKLCNKEEIPSIGMKISTVSSNMAEIYGVPKGVYVDGVSLNSPAWNAGIQKGDVVVGFEKDTISTAKQYTTHLMNTEPGSNVKLKVLRYSGGEYREITVIVVVTQQ